MSDVHTLTSELDRLANRPTSLLNREYWFPMALFGVLSIGAAAMFSQWDPETTNSWAWWAILGPAGGIATAFWFKRQGENLGIYPRNPAIYAAIGISCSIGCALAGIFAPSVWVYPTILGIVGVLNIALAIVDRSTLMMTVGTGLICIGLLGGLGSVDAPQFSAIAGAFMLGSAAAHLLQR